MPSLRICRAKPPHPHTPSWRAQDKQPPVPYRTVKSANAISPSSSVTRSVSNWQLLRKLRAHYRLHTSPQLYVRCSGLATWHERVYFYWSSGLLLVRTVTVSLSVASINDESRLPTSVLFAVPTDGYNMEVSTHAMPNGLGFRSRQNKMTSPKCPDRPWGPPSG